MASRFRHGSGLHTAMHTIRVQYYQSIPLPQEIPLRDMFDGALPPEPPATPAPATHDFLVMCLRPDDPPPRQTLMRYRPAA